MQTNDVAPLAAPVPHPLAGESVLITGGGGSFGQAFAKEALSAGARKVVIYSRDEAKQAAMREQVRDHRLRFLIGDVRDEQRLRRAMEGVSVVVHGAAMKRIEVCQEDVDECRKTNVNGTANVISAAKDAMVGRVVMLSTDKACSPVNAYGASKLMAEHLMLAANNARGSHGPIYAVTRYGNVAGSRGSVIPMWRAALRVGDEVPVTDPEMTRYWMSMDEAVALVVWTLGHMEGGELVVPDLPAYRLADLAEAMGAVPFVVGPRPGEKAHESMIGEDEVHEFSQPDPYFVRRLNRKPVRRLVSAHRSDGARRLSVDDLRGLLAAVPA